MIHCQLKSLLTKTANCLKSTLYSFYFAFSKTYLYLSSKLPPSGNLSQQLIWPFWDSWNNLRLYLDSVTLVAKEAKANRKWLIFSQTELVLSLLTVRCAQLLYISFVKSLPTFWRQLLHDYMLYLGSPPRVNLQSATFIFQTVFFTLQMHCLLNYDAHFRPLYIVRQALFHPYNDNDKSLFLKPRVKVKQKAILVNDQIQARAKRYIQFPNYFYLLLCCLILFFNVQQLLYITENASYFLLTFPLGTLSLLFALLNALISNYALIRSGMVNITLSVVIFTFSLVIFTRLKQANELLLRKRNLNEFNFKKFASFHTETLALVVAGSGYFGVLLLLLFILLHMPINAYMSIQIASRRYAPVPSFVYANVNAFQYVYIFGFHLLSAMYSTRTHSCSRLLLGWKRLGKRCSKSKWKSTRWWKVAMYIEKFHTVNRYGITYGSFALISYESLFKVSASFL